jgi:hypothetical protein
MATLWAHFMVKWECLVTGFLVVIGNRTSRASLFGVMVTS